MYGIRALTIDDARKLPQPRPDDKCVGRPETRTDSDDVRELVGRASSGEKAAFAELWVRFEKVLFHTAFRLTRNETDAMDVVQNALVRSYKGISTYDGKRPFRAWLTAITVNEARRLLKQRRRIRTVPLSQIGEATAPGRHRSLEALTRVEVNDALDHLPREERMAFVLRYVEGYASGEVADVMSVSERTVRRLCLSAKRKLRRLLGGDENV